MNRSMRSDEQTFAFTLHKDLIENEEVCPNCKGLGLVVRDNSYGIDGKHGNNHLHMFPYKHQSMTFCPICYNGVIRRCELCGEIIQRGFLRHNCEKQYEIDMLEREKREAEALKNAPLAPPEVLKKNKCFYSDSYSCNEGYFLDWEDFIDDWYVNHEEDEPKPEFVWTTEEVKMKIDAANLIESATDDLYEEAYHDISEKESDRLQKFLDEWCENCGVGETYYQGKYKVRIPWEEYDG